MSEDIDAIAVELRRGVMRLASRFRSERLEGEVPDAALLVLVVLEKREPLSLTELADAAKVTLGSMTQTVRRLEQLTFVTKARDTVDRRRVQFALTSTGRAAATASRQHRADWLSHRLSDLTEIERADIARLSALLLRLADS